MRHGRQQDDFLGELLGVSSRIYGCPLSSNTPLLQVHRQLFLAILLTLDERISCFRHPELAVRGVAESHGQIAGMWSRVLGWAAALLEAKTHWQPGRYQGNVHQGKREA